MDTLLRIGMRNNFENMYMHKLEKLKQIFPCFYRTFRSD
jgi:hypothetical protein